MREVAWATTFTEAQNSSRSRKRPLFVDFWDPT